MDSNNQIIIGFVISLIGTAFGWFLNQTSDWWSQSRAKKRSLKVIIFNLLELFQLLVKSDFSKFSDGLTNQITKKINDPNLTEESKNQMRKILTETFSKVFKPMLISDFESIKHNYEDAIQELSTIDPIRAYYLKGKNEIWGKLQLLPELMNQIKTMSPDEFDKGNEKLQSLLDDAVSKLLENSIDEIESEIYEISWMVGILQWIRIKKTIKTIKRISDIDNNKQIHVLLKEFEMLLSDNAVATK